MSSSVTPPWRGPNCRLRRWRSCPGWPVMDLPVPRRQQANVTSGRMRAGRLAEDAPQRSARRGTAIQG
jgi:hypothetical protein